MLDNFNALVKAYKAAHEAGEDTTIYHTAIAACREFNAIGEDTINSNVVHAVHEFAHMLAANPENHMTGTADDAVTAFFSNIAQADLSETILNDDYPGAFVPANCEHQTGSAFAKTLLRQADFESIFEKFDELSSITTLKEALSRAFHSHNERGDGPQIEMHLLSGDDALDFLRGFGVLTEPEATPEYAASGETSGPVAHNDNGAEERD